jgi:hypothetical protein
VRIALLVLLLPAVAGCSSVWNALNRGSLEADVPEVLARALRDPPQIKCQMIGTTRSGYCTFHQEDAAALAVARAVGLQSGVVDPDGPDEIVLPFALGGMVGCLSSEVLGPVEGQPVYWIAGRPETLSLQSGRQFEYLLLILHPDAGQACVQVSYAYG